MELIQEIMVCYPFVVARGGQANFTVYLEIQYKETYNASGAGGKSGQQQTQTIINLKGGESAFIFVGKSTEGAVGERAQISINGQQVICAGGGHGLNGIKGQGVVNSVGETTAFLCFSGNGGNGEAHYNTSVDRKGKIGCVKITY